MKRTLRGSSTILILAICVSTAFSQQKIKLGDNSALRYWSAFAQMRDDALTDEEAKKLSGIIDGTLPYDDLKFRNLVEKNQHALETMARGTTLTNCDWGLDYALGQDAPFDYPGKAASLARLNILYALHLQTVGDQEGSSRALAAGLRFSRDIANGGPLLATLVAKDSLVRHLRVIASVLRANHTTADQRLILQKALAQLGSEPLDWKATIKLEMNVLGGLHYSSSVLLARVTQSYVTTLSKPSGMPQLQEMIAALPQGLRDLIPNPKRVLEEQQDLKDKLRETRSLLQ